jgi:hypothetical protein
MHYIKIAFVLCIAIVLFGAQTFFNTQIGVVVEEPFGGRSIVQMSRKEAKDLDYFFREIMIPDSLAYTLIGEKPLSFTCLRQPGSSLLSLMPPNLKLIRGWKTWKKYQHFFQTSRVKFWAEKSPWVKGIICIVLADTDYCNRLMKQNATDFGEILGQQTEDFFSDVGQIHFFQNTLQMHEALIGILLGYGKENAWLYWGNILKKSSCSKLTRIGNSILEEESAGYSWKYCTLQTMDMLDLKLPQFVGNPDSDESKNLMERYLAARGKIKEFYETRDFLSATLSLYKHGSVLLDYSAEGIH